VINQLTSFHMTMNNLSNTSETSLHLHRKWRVEGCPGTTYTLDYSSSKW